MDLGEEFTKLAQDQLMAFFDLEGECLTWVTTAGPVVLELTDMFSSLLPFSAQAYSGAPVNPAARPDTD
jgi:hypothetical protein